jgi:tRNA1Val (adenine37-N6)-methyltransferase
MDVSQDGLLNNRLRLWQPVKTTRAYRFTSDSVLLAAAVPASEGQWVLELGCGVGAAALCLLSRVAGSQVVGLELDLAMAKLAGRNAHENGLVDRLLVIGGNATQPPFTADRPLFDHVMLNPPYYDPSRERVGRAQLARFEAGDQMLADWLSPLSGLIKPGGSLTLIYPANRRQAALAALPGGFGGVTLLPLASKAGSPAKRLLLQAWDGAAPGVIELPPLILHHPDGSFTDGANQLLRGGGALTQG